MIYVFMIQILVSEVNNQDAYSRIRTYLDHQDTQQHEAEKITKDLQSALSVNIILEIFSISVPEVLDCEIQHVIIQCTNEFEETYKRTILSGTPDRGAILVAEEGK